jgi:hypothetical protein
MKLDSWMLKKKMHPSVRAAILLRLLKWYQGTPPSTPSWDSPLKLTLKSQATMGWYPFLLGHVSNHWKAVQQACYTSLGLDNTGKQWVRQLILQLFNISWDMWEHLNGIKYSTLTPAKINKIHQLDDHIQAEFATGSCQLLPHNKRWFSSTPDNLTKKSTTCRKHNGLPPLQMPICDGYGGKSSNLPPRMPHGSFCGTGRSTPLLVQAQPCQSNKKNINKIQAPL